MKRKILAVFLACAMLFTGCSFQDAANSSTPESNVTDEESIVTEVENIITEALEISEEPDLIDEEIENTVSLASIDIDPHSEEYVQSLGFTSLNDDNLLRYVEDTVYYDLVNELDSDKYFVENVEAVYISKEYLDELAYNSQSNIYFGYTLEQLEECFQGQEYIFTLGDNGQTTVQLFEEYDDTYDQVIRNVAIGTGVILLCVTVSVVTGGLGAPAVSMVFAASAKSAAIFAVSSGAISGVAAGITEGIETHDFDKALKAAALEGSEAFKWGAVTGAVAGGASEAVALKGATLNGLTMNEAAAIQKESQYPLDVIKQFSNMDQYKICKEAGLTTKMINGKTTLIRSIDLNYIDEATGLTNLELMQQGRAAIDPISGLPYELHHIGQKADSTLAILTKAEHMQNGNNKIWHVFGNASEAHAPGNTWDSQRMEVWKALATVLSK